MAKILTSNQNYYDIADTIRQMKNVNTTYKPRQMASALKDIYSNEVEGVPPLSFESNGMPLIDYRIDGASGGVGDRTKNLFNIDDLLNAPRGKLGNADFDHVLSLELKPNTTYVFSSSGSGSIDGDSNYNRSVYVAGSDVQNAIFNGRPYITKTDNTGIIRIAILSSRENAQQYINKVASIQVEEGSTATDYEPYGHKVPVAINGKNLLNTKLSTIQLGAGITFQKNNDGTVVLNGTPSSNFSLLAFPVYLTAASYVLNGCPESQDATKLRCDLRNSQYATVGGFDIGNGVRISVNSPGNYFFGIRVGAGYNCNNLKFYPMMRLSTIEDDTYEQYIEPTTTNIYLDEPIEENESISLSDTEIDIPTIEGTNTLTIDTTVQPSNVYVQAPKDSIEATQIASELEEI